MSNTNVAVGKKSKGAGCLRWLGRVALGGLILLLGLAAIGAIYQAVASARDAKIYKPVDQMVDVNGIQMRLDCKGSGSPTVVLEAGAGGSSITWVRIQNDVAKFTRVCSYDRAGYGWSDSVHEAMLPQQVAEMLYALLEKGGERPPYLMVAHSLGGVYVRTFAAEYPNDVVGMVLVDSSHEKQVQQAPPELEKLGNMQMASTRFLQMTEPIGLLRAFRMMEPGIASFQLAEEQKALVLAEMYRTGYLDASVREMEMFTAYSRQFKKLSSLGDMPLIVFSQKMDAQKLFDQYPPNIQSQLTMELMQQVADRYNEQQQELAALSTRGKQIIVEGSGHFIQLDKPQLVIDAIQEVFGQAAR